MFLEMYILILFKELVFIFERKLELYIFPFWVLSLQGRPPKYIEHLVKKYFLKKVDIVIGSRNLLKKRNSSLSFFRYISSIIIIYVISFFLGKKTSDPLSGFFIFRKKIYKKNKKKLYANGYKILADLIYNSDKTLKILDQDIFFDTRKSGKSKMNVIILIKLLIFIMISFKKKLI